MKFILVILICLFPANVIADCKVIEYTDHNEVVCQDNKPSSTYTSTTMQERDKENSAKYYGITVANSSEAKSKAVAAISDDQALMIAKNAPPDQVAAKNSDAERLISELKYICDRASLVDSPFIGSCMGYYGLTVETLAGMMLRSAKYYAVKGNKAAAKQMFRDVIIRFTGNNFKSQVKEAEFALDDLK